MSVSAYWGKWAFEMTRGWSWLECWRRCLRAKWGTIRETVIRCMHVDRATECSPWTVWCHKEGDHTVRAQHQTPIKLNCSWQQNQADAYIRRKVLWPPHPVFIHAWWLAIILMPSHFAFHSCIGQLSKKLSRATVTQMNWRLLVKGDTLCFRQR